MKPLDPQALFGSPQAAGVIGAEGEVLAETESTMAVARERLAEGAPDGYVVVAEHQTAGRGRSGAWHCPPGHGILMSVVLKRGLPASEQMILGLMGAVAAAEAIARFGVPALIKWPNDVVVAEAAEGAPRVRKLGGVLVERVMREGAAPAYVLGVGLNVNQSAGALPPDTPLPPTSMRIEKGRPFDRNVLGRALLAALDGWYRRLAMGQREHVLARWRSLNCLLGRDVRVRLDGRALHGRVMGLRSTGELIFRDAAGRRHFLSDDRATVLL